MNKKTPTKMGAMFDGVSDSSAFPTPGRSPKTPSRGTPGRTPLKSAIKTPLTSPLKNPITRTYLRIRALESRFLTCKPVFFTLAALSAVSVWLAVAAFVTRGLPAIVRARTPCETGDRRVNGICVRPGSIEERAYNLSSAVRQTILLKKRDMTVEELADEVETQKEERIEPEILERAVNFCDDLEVFNGRIYLKISNRSEEIAIYIVAVVTTAMFLLGLHFRYENTKAAPRRK